MDKIITPDKYPNHNVQKYEFKTFDANKNSPKPITTSIKEPIITKEDTPKPDTIIPKDDQVSKELIKSNEEILLKIKELQEKIEQQEKDFAQRLELETKKAFELGKEEGIKESSQDINEQNSEIKNQFIKSIASLSEQQTKIDTFLQKIESDIPKLAIMIAKKVINKELDESSSQITKSTINSLLENLKDISSIVIKVNPYDYNDIKKEYQESKYIKIKPDDAIAKGGVVIISDGGNIDANLSTRIEKIIELIEKDY